MLNLLVLVGNALAKKNTVTCPPGYELHSDVCRKWIDLEMKIVCEHGVLSDKRCVETASPHPVCLNGEYDDKVCLSYEVASPQVVCPTGFELSYGDKSAQCEQPYTYSVKAPCPKGTQENGKQCMSKSYVAPSYWCPPGTNMQGNWCLMYEKYDCTPKMTPVTKTHKKHGHGHKKHLRLLGAHEPHIIDEKKGKQQISVISKTCEKEIKTPVVKECPPDTFQSGKDCIQTHYHERGTIEKVDYNRIHAETICPKSFDWCHTSKKKHHENKETCCLRRAEEPLWECPHGFEQSHHGCTRYYEPIYVCPESKGKKKSHHGHYEHGSKNSCGRYDYVDAIRTFSVRVEDSHHKKKHH